MKDQRVKGTMNTVEGTVKKGVGKVTGNLGLQAKGEAQVLQGKAQRGVGDVQAAVRKVDGSEH